MTALDPDPLVRPAWKTLGDTLGITIGSQYRMRNGHTAIVERFVEIPFIEGMTGKPAKFPIWVGHCLCCQTPCSWNLDGSYAASGRHAFDLVRIMSPIPSS